MRIKRSRGEEVEGNEGRRRGARRNKREKQKILTASVAYRISGWSRIQ